MNRIIMVITMLLFFSCKPRSQDNSSKAVVGQNDSHLAKFLYTHSFESKLFPLWTHISTDSYGRKSNVTRDNALCFYVHIAHPNSDKASIIEEAKPVTPMQSTLKNFPHLSMHSLKTTAHGNFLNFLVTPRTTWQCSQS